MRKLKSAGKEFSKGRSRWEVKIKRVGKSDHQNLYPLSSLGVKPSSRLTLTNLGAMSYMWPLSFGNVACH